MNLRWSFVSYNFWKYALFQLTSGIDTWNHILKHQVRRIEMTIWLQFTLGDSINDSLGYNKSFLFSIFFEMINVDPKYTNCHQFVINYVRNTWACLFFSSYARVQKWWKQNPDSHKRLVMQATFLELFRIRRAKSLFVTNDLWCQRWYVVVTNLIFCQQIWRHQYQKYINNTLKEIYWYCTVLYLLICYLNAVLMELKLWSPDQIILNSG